MSSLWTGKPTKRRNQPNAADFANRSTARKGAHHHGEEIGRRRSTSGRALALFPQQINRARGAHHHGEEIRYQRSTKGEVLALFP